jgi:hypothetical protein
VPALLHFFVRRVFPARVAEFLRFEPVLVLFPVLGGCIVPVFAIVALQCDNFAHNRLLDDLRDGSGAHRVAAFPDREPQPLLQRHRRN